MSFIRHKSDIRRIARQRVVKRPALTAIAAGTRWPQPASLQRVHHVNRISKSRVMDAIPLDQHPKHSQRSIMKKILAAMFAMFLASAVMAQAAPEAAKPAAAAKAEAHKPMKHHKKTMHKKAMGKKMEKKAPAASAAK